ncbi:MAG: ribulose-phosphate 3-epimerase [Candidatus Limnocylindrales bacterium]
MIEIAPSILAADQGHLADQVRDTFEAGIRRLHVDIMDGRFVPNITIGPPVVAALQPIAARYGATIETHLMIVEPDLWLEPFREAGADLVTVHVEAAPHLHRTLQRIRELGSGAGAALNPATPLSALEEVLDELDLALVMTVEPGFGGQVLIPATLDKVRRLRAMLDERGLGDRVALEVDGGVHAGTIGAAQAAGATLAVAGTAVFNSDGSIAANLRVLRAACAAAG